MTNLDQGVGYDLHAKVWQDEGVYRSAIISLIREHNNTQGSPLYMKLGERKTILSISMDEWRIVASGIFQQPTKYPIFIRVLAKMLAEGYGITAFEIQNGSYMQRDDVAQDHKEVLMKSYPTDEFLGWIKENEGAMVDLPSGTNTVNVSSDVIAKYLEAARTSAERMGAKEDPNLDLSGLIT